MSADTEMLLGYWLIGFVLTILFDRKMNGPLSILDVAACALIAFAWPVIAAIVLIVSIAYSAPWLTKKRW
jgi:hypothetical protein